MLQQKHLQKQTVIYLPSAAPKDQILQPSKSTSAAKKTKNTIASRLLVVLLVWVKLMKSCSYFSLKKVYTGTSQKFEYHEKGQYFLSLISESETHILYRLITQSEIFQAFISWNCDDYGLQIMILQKNGPFHDILIFWGVPVHFHKKSFTFKCFPWSFFFKLLISMGFPVVKSEFNLFLTSPHFPWLP